MLRVLGKGALYAELPQSVELRTGPGFLVFPILEHRKCYRNCYLVVYCWLFGDVSSPVFLESLLPRGKGIGWTFSNDFIEIRSP